MKTLVFHRPGQMAWEGAADPAVAAVPFEMAAARATQSRLELLAEHDRIGRELHNNVIGRLFATGMSMQSALGRFDDIAVRGVLTNAVDEIDDAIREIRTVLSVLRSATDLDQSDPRRDPGSG